MLHLCLTHLGAGWKHIQSYTQITVIQIPTAAKVILVAIE